MTGHYFEYKTPSFVFFQYSVNYTYEEDHTDKFSCDVSIYKDWKSYTNEENELQLVSDNEIYYENALSLAKWLRIDTPKTEQKVSSLVFGFLAQIFPNSVTELDAFDLSLFTFHFKQKKQRR